MQLSRTPVGDGIVYNHLQTSAFKTGYLSVNFLVPLARESAAYYSLLPSVLLRGSRLYPDQKSITRRSQELYGLALQGRSYRAGDAQVISFSLDTLDRAYLPKGETLDLLGEGISFLFSLICDPLLENGSFRPDYVEGEKANRRNSLRAKMNNKLQLAIDRHRTRMYEGEAAGISPEGEVQDFEDAFTPARLTDYYTRLLRQAQIEVYYVGGEDEKTVLPLIKSAISTIERAGKTMKLPAANLRVAERVRRFEESVAATQGILVQGYRTGVGLGGQGEAVFSMFVEIFGGSPASKLFMNVREKHSLCYYCNASPDLPMGAFVVYAGIDNTDREKVEREIAAQLEAVRRAEITDEEFACSRQSIINDYRAIYDSAEAIERWYVRRAASGAILSPEEKIRAIEHVTVADVVSLARCVTQDTVYFQRGALPCAKEDACDA